MADPKYYVGSTVARKVQGLIKGEPFDLSAAVIDAWDPADAQVVTAGIMTRVGSRASFLIPASAILVAGIFKVEFTLTFSNNQGVLHFQENFTILARFP